MVARGPCDASSVGELSLPVAHVDAVVVGRMKGRGRRRRNPRAVCAGKRVVDLLGEHVGHQVGRRPHALADLGPAGQAAGEPDVDVPLLVRLDPTLSLHLALANHRAGGHRRVDLVTGSIEEAGVDERDARPRRADALAEVQRRAALLVHDPDLDGVHGEAEHLLDPREDLVGERDLVGAVHLRLDDVDGTEVGVRGSARRAAGPASHTAR